MAHLRFALVAWLSIGIRDPGLLLAHLNRLCRQLAITGTAVVAVYDPADRTLRWARAGHLPPLLARAGGDRRAGAAAGTAAGRADDAGYPVVAVDLRGDDLVLFYTDGLVERRGQSTLELLDEVKDTLSEVSTAARRRDPLRVLRGRLHYASPDDDTCTVAVRVLP